MTEIVTGWMDWKDIVPYLDQLIKMEQILAVKYHYPDGWYDINGYCAQRVKALETHLSNGNTYFWGARYKNELIGYYWAYIQQFIDKKRWCLRSLMIKEEYQRQGLGSMAINDGLKKAKSLGCNESSTECAVQNTAAAKAYQRAGYKITRIEFVKRLEEIDVKNVQSISDLCRGGVQ